MFQNRLKFGNSDDILFAIDGNVAFITLNREKVLNAINANIAVALFEALRHFEKDDSIVALVIEGAGRAFCSGGDIVAAYHAGQRGEPAYDFFKLEYLFNIYLKHYPKPYLALLNGIVMGGGAGISAHGKYRIVTENTIFAMPEANIGFFTDVGAAYFLQTSSLAMRLYLCLTGGRLAWGGCFNIGVATHCVKAVHLAELKTNLVKELAGLTWGVKENNSKIFAIIDHLLTSYHDFIAPEFSDAQLAIIEDCFCNQTLELCCKKLSNYEQQGNAFASKILAMLKPLSPLSLKIIYKHVVEAQRLSLQECMRIEYRITTHMLKGYEFYEGIRAALIDKDKQPRWQYNSIEQVPDEKVAEYFAHNGMELF